MNKPNKPLYNETIEKFSRFIIPALVLAGIGAHKIGFTTVYHCLIATAAVLCIPLVLFRYKQQRCRYAETVYGHQLISAFSGKGQKNLRRKLVDAVYLLDKKEKYRKAADILEYLEDRCQTDADFAIVQTFLGDCYRGMANYPEAKCYYIDALSHNDKSAMAWDNLGSIHAKYGELEKSVECRQKAIECDDKYALAYYNLGSTYYKMDEYEKCIENCLQSLKLMPRFVSPAEILSAAYYHVGDKAKSDEYFRMVGLLGGDQKLLLEDRANFDKELQEANAAASTETAEA